MGNATSLSNTPQAKDDIYTFVDDSFFFNGDILTLNVLANDLGGNAKTLFSIDNGYSSVGTLSPNDLLLADTLVNGVSAWEATANGDSVRIYNGKVQLDITNSLNALGVTSYSGLTANDHIHDSFIYAERLGNGTLSWATVTVDIQGQNDKATISGQSTGSIGEDDTTPVQGTLTVVDSDRGESHTQSIANGTTSTGLGTYSVDADGHWSYNVNNAAVQYLNTGETATDTFVVKSFDGTASQTVTVTINGQNESVTLQEDFYAADQSWRMALGDFNADGKQDIAVTSFTYGTNTILTNDGTGHFSLSSTSVPQAQGIVSGDINGDGKADLITATTYYSQVSVQLGNGDGTFQPAALSSGGFAMADVALADFNGDGKLDVASTSFYDGQLSVFIGNGDGTLAPRTTIGAGGYANYGLETGDFNGDGHQDIVMAWPEASGSESAAVVAFGQGDGQFDSPINVMVPKSPVWVEVADLGDGKNDIVMAGRNNLVTVLHGNADKTFTVDTYSLGPSPSMGAVSAAIGDVNGDGIKDIVSANSGDGATNGSLTVLFGTGNGQFGGTTTIDVTHGAPSDVQIGDFNGDGKEDVAYSSTQGVTVINNFHDFLLSL